jgi:hypothetical protein
MNQMPPADEAAAETPHPDPIPTEETALTEFVRKTPGHNRWLIASWLKQQQDGRDFTALVDRLIEQIHNEEAIDAGRHDLNLVLTDALDALRAAAHIHTALTDHLFDVEHAEGDGLFGHHLEAAVISLRTAIAVNPTAK